MFTHELIERLKIIAKQRHEAPLEPFRIPVEKLSEWVAAERLAILLEEVARLREALKPFADIPSVSLFPSGGHETAKHYWVVIGAPNKSHFTQSDLIRARAVMARDLIP